MSGEAADGLPLDNGGQTFELLAERIDSLLAAWEEGPPTLRDFVPTHPPSLRRLALVELIKVDMECRWKRGMNDRRIEDYLDEFPDLTLSSLPSDLVYEEYQIRKQAGDLVDKEEYLQRFPRQAAELSLLLTRPAGIATTAVYGGSKLIESVQVGDTLDDFDLLAHLGKGAFASVFLARQRSMQRLVALKVSADKGDEPQTLAQLDHPHIVRVYDQRLAAEQGLRLLYMQYIAGGTLQDVLGIAMEAPAGQRNGRTFLKALDQILERRGESPPVDSSVRKMLAGRSWPQVVGWLGERIASALDYAHKRGVLHRDVKPANVLLTGEGVPKLADFNVSFTSSLEGACASAFFGGSLAYMSPEQLEASNPVHPREADSLDGRTDVYSLGVLLWEMLTGERPFRDEKLAGDWKGTLEAMTERRQIGVSGARLPPSCPVGIRQTILECLEPSPTARPRTGADVARKLALSQLPRVRAMLDPTTKDWRRFAGRLPFFAIGVLVVTPNAFASVFNLMYNHEQIVDPLVRKLGLRVFEFFWVFQQWINGVCFPAGLTAILLYARPVVKGFHQRKRRESIPAVELAYLRKRCLNIGAISFWVSVALWSIAGVLYPLSMHVFVTPLDWHAWAHFMASLVVCGLMAGVYPYFLNTFYCVRVLLPPLFRFDETNAGDLENFSRLKKRARIRLLLAALIPTLTLTFLVLLDMESKMAMSVFCLCGCVGFGIVYWLSRNLEEDLDSLSEAVWTTDDLLQLSGEMSHHAPLAH